MHPRVQTRYLAAWGAGVAVNTAIFVYIALVRPYVLGDTREWEVRGAGGHWPLAARVREHARAGTRARTCTGATDAHARTRSARAHTRDRCLTCLATPSGPPLSPPPHPLARPHTRALLSRPRPPPARPHAQASAPWAIPTASVVGVACFAFFIVGVWPSYGWLAPVVAVVLFFGAVFAIGLVPGDGRSAAHGGGYSRLANDD